MVPVRKPGRPLSLCPHPPSRPCGCAGVTAAIPRKQKCRCGPSKTPTTKDDPSPKLQSPSPSDTPPKSPARANSASGTFRVQKAPKPPSRKASIDPASLDRIDPSQVNIMPSLGARNPLQSPNGNPAIHAIPNLPDAQYGHIHVPSPHGQGVMNPMMYPIFPHQMAPPVSGHAMASIPAEEHASSLSNDALLGGHSRNNSHGPGIHKRTGSGANGNGVQKKGSCCGSSSSAAAQAPSIPSLDPTQAPHIPQPSPGMIMPGVGHQGQPFSHFYPHPTVFTYPPHYGSYLQPLLPELWKQAMDSMMAQGLANTDHMPSPNFNYMAAAGPSTPTLGTSHICTCGDGCQCVGCAAHPYNDATQNYVKSAWNMMMDDTWANGVNSPITPHAPPQVKRDLHRTNGTHAAPMKQEGASCCGGNGNASSSASPILPPQMEGAGSNGAALGIGAPATSTLPGATSPKASPTPQTPASDTTTGTNDEQVLSANDFFFVTYPLTDSCVGDTASCPCGDDCQCLGCVVHGNAPGTDPTVALGI